MTAPLHVMVVTHELEAGGAERQVSHLARGLAELGNQVTAVCIGDPGGSTAALEQAGVRIVALGAHAPKQRILALGRLTALARAADVVICSSWDATLWGRLAAIAAFRPVVVIEHALDRGMQTSLSGKPRGRWIAAHNRLLDPLTYATVACAQAQLNVLRTEGVDMGKTVYIPNGVPIDALRAQAVGGVERDALGLAPDAFVLAHVARLTAVKNQQQTIDTVRALRAEGIDAHALLIGDGEDLARLESEVGADPAIQLLGARDDVPALLALADVCLLPSHAEAMPMVVAEALAMGTPIVAYAVGDVAGILERTAAGFAVTAEDGEAFTEACRALAVDSGAREAASANALAAAAEFDDLIMSRRYVALLDAAAAQRPPGSVRDPVGLGPDTGPRMLGVAQDGAGSLPAGDARRVAEGTPDDVLVLAYHAVSDEWDAVTTVTVEQFRAQMESLVAAGYQGVTLEQALLAPPPGLVVAVTFDDAHVSVHTRAFPIMTELGMVGTIFAPTDYIGTGEPTAWEGFEADAAGPHRDELVCMDWDALNAVADAGWEIGSHTCSHPHLSQLPDARLAEELVRSRAVIEERTGRPCRTLAYPYSDHDSRVVEATRVAGYAVATTIPVGGAVGLPLRWPRVGVFRTDTLRRFKVLTAPATRRFLVTTAGAATADAVRTVKAIRRRL